MKRFRERLRPAARMGRIALMVVSP